MWLMDVMNSTTAKTTNTHQQNSLSILSSVSFKSFTYFLFQRNCVRVEETLQCVRKVFNTYSNVTLFVSAFQSEIK